MQPHKGKQREVTVEVQVGILSAPGTIIIHRDAADEPVRWTDRREP